jgi:hypothetical protein
MSQFMWWFCICVFIYGLLNEAVTKSDYIALNGVMIIEW